MRRVAVVFACLMALCFAAPARATVSVAIDLSHQTMHVQSSTGSYDWPISSARSGFSTPGGSYAPTSLEVMHYSHKYHMSPMPHAIFFRGGYAIHGTYATGSLGRPASHGCVRLSPGNAAHLFAMVKAEGARISISGSPPASAPFYAARHRPAVEAAYRADPGFDAMADGDADQAPRRVLRSQRVEAAYSAYGYRYVGRFHGRNVYQAAPGAVPPAGGLFGDGFLN